MFSAKNTLIHEYLGVWHVSGIKRFHEIFVWTAIFVIIADCSTETPHLQDRLCCMINIVRKINAVLLSVRCHYYSNDNHLFRWGFVLQGVHCACWVALLDAVSGYRNGWIYFTFILMGKMVLVYEHFCLWTAFRSVLNWGSTELINSCIREVDRIRMREIRGGWNRSMQLARSEEQWHENSSGR